MSNLTLLIIFICGGYAALALAKYGLTLEKAIKPFIVVFNFIRNLTKKKNNKSNERIEKDRTRIVTDYEDISESGKDS